MRPQGSHRVAGIGSTAPLMSGGQLTLPNPLRVLRVPEGALLQRGRASGRHGVQGGTAASLTAYAQCSMTLLRSELRGVLPLACALPPMQAQQPHTIPPF